MVKYCQYCKENFKKINPDHPFANQHPGYLNHIIKEAYQCPFCNNKMTDIDINDEDFEIILNISNESSFIDAMVELKENDPIEFQLKISQFKNQTSQQKTAEQDNIPKCPTCGSANIEKISLAKKAVGGVMFGLFSSNVRKTMCCKNCGYKW